MVLLHVLLLNLLQCLNYIGFSAGTCDLSVETDEHVTTYKKLLNELLGSIQGITKTVSVIPQGSLSNLQTALQIPASNGLPPGLVSIIESMLYEQTEAKEYEMFSELLQKAKALKGYETCGQVFEVVGNLMPSEIIMLIHKLQQIPGNWQLSLDICQEIEEYLKLNQKIIDPQTIQVLYRLLDEYGYKYDRQSVPAISSWPAINVISMENITQQILLSPSNTATFTVQGYNECKSELFCTARLTSTICPFGGGICRTKLKTTQIKNVLKLTCSFTVDTCANEPPALVLSQDQIIEDLRQRGQSQFWVDVPELCSAQRFCNNPHVLSQVAPYGGGVCQAQFNNRVCLIKWQNSPQGSETCNLPRPESTDILEGAIGSDGVSFQVASEAKCTEYCENIAFNWKSKCPGQFKCCVSLQSYGLCTKCNIRHQCLSSFNRGLEPNALNVSEISNKVETVEIPLLTPLVKVFNKTISGRPPLPHHDGEPEMTDLPVRSGVDYSIRNPSRLKKEAVTTKNGNDAKSKTGSQHRSSKTRLDDDGIQRINIHFNV